MLTKEAVLDALRTVQEPELGADLVSLDMIRDVEVDGDKVRFTLVLTTSFCPLGMEIQERCEEAVRRLPEVRDVTIRMTDEVEFTGGIP
jgi:ATP-binding protein involved in chromosome partitioning